MNDEFGIKSRQLQAQLASLWSSQEVARLFGVTPMTIWLWRENRGLPKVELKGTARPAIRFVPEDVLAWAKARQIRMYPIREGREARVAA